MPPRTLVPPLARPPIHSCGVALRPCPVVSCKHSLVILDRDRAGRGRPSTVKRDESDSCTLDVVARHPDGLTLDLVGSKLGIVRERVRQIESRALWKLQAKAKALQR